MDKKEVFKKFLEENEVLIVDKNPSSRSRLLKTIYDLGAKRHMIHTAATLAEATEIIDTKKVGIVLSDYFIGGGSGFDLFKLVREKSPKAKDISLILVTSNISQTAVAKAAEEDVDSFVIKPYTVQSIQENLITTVVSKIKPSDYMLKVEEGKGFIQSGKYDEAIEALQAATALHSKPALALFYIGQAEYLKQNVDEATGSYNKGLNFNNIHFKCLIGLYEIFMREEKYHEAYQVVKKIAKYFPANPDRLTQIVRLAIRTGNYEDMQMYYEIFTTLEERAEVLINYIGAGMYIAGKHSLLNNNVKGALQFFDNIAVSCTGFTKFLRAIICLLVEHDMAAAAEIFLIRFDASSRDHEDFLISDYLVNCKKFSDSGRIIKEGLQLYNRNIRDYHCLQLMVQTMEMSGYNKDKILPFKKEIASLYPEKVASA